MKFLRKKTAADKIGYHPSSLMRLVREGRFPKPVPTEGSAVLFLEEEVDAWMQARLDRRDNDTGDVQGG